MKPRRTRLAGAWSMAVIAGIAVSPRLGLWWLKSPVWLLVGVVCAVLAYLMRARLPYVFIICAGLIFGLNRGSAQAYDSYVINRYVGKVVSLEGTVSGDLETDSKDQVVVKLTSLKIGDTTYRGDARITLSYAAQIKRSSRVVFEGKLTAGFGTYVATMYRPRVVSVVQDTDTARDVRDRFADGVVRAIGKEPAGLGLGFLTGQKTYLTREAENNLRLIGLSHIIVASGYNLTILVEFMRSKLKRWSRFVALGGSCAAISGFMLVTGLSPSMVRAGIVASISLAAWYYGRKLNPFVLVLLSAAVSALIKPSYIWGDLGWYLSFLSFFGVLLVGPLITQYFFSDKVAPNRVRSLVIETSSAQVMTLPLTIAVFGAYSPLALIANMAVLPLIPLTMAMVFIAGIGGIVFPQFLAQAMGYPAYILIEYIVRVSRWFANSPYATSELHFGNGTMLILYAFLGIFICYMYQATHSSSIFNWTWLRRPAILKK